MAGIVVSPLVQCRCVVVSDLDKLPAMFSTMTRDGFDAMTLLSACRVFSARQQISNLAAMHRLPVMYESREFVIDGGLISYGANIPDLTRRAAAFDSQSHQWGKACRSSHSATVVAIATTPFVLEPYYMVTIWYGSMTSWRAATVLYRSHPGSRSGFPQPQEP
jgi:hypothetical protein